MRIIAGTKRGMALLSPKTRVSRPITDRVKESLFSVLYNYGLPSGARVADLFSGVGSMGLEALSRGAVFVTFVDKDHDIVSILKKNIERAGFVGVSKIVRANAFKTGAVGDAGAGYDLVFVDPPYAAAQDTGADSALAGLLALVSEQIVEGGIVVVRTSENVSLLEQYGQLRVIERRKWGTMTVTILTRNTQAKST